MASGQLPVSSTSKLHGENISLYLGVNVIRWAWGWGMCSGNPTQFFILESDLVGYPTSEALSHLRLHAVSDRILRMSAVMIAVCLKV